MFFALDIYMSSVNTLYDDDQVQNLAVELMNSNVPIRELPQIQTLINTHQNLQTDLQPLINSNRLAERLNNHSQADIDTVVNTVDSMRSMSRIYQSLQHENISVQAAEIINTEGGNIISNLAQICSRTVREVQQNTVVLQAAIEQNERTIHDPQTNSLLQQQLEITASISIDPRRARRQIQQAIEINNQLQDRIEQIEPDANANVRIAVQSNSKYLKYAAGIAFIGAAAIAMTTGVVYLAPIVTNALAAASVSASTQTIPIIPSMVMASKFLSKIK